MPGPCWSSSIERGRHSVSEVLEGRRRERARLIEAARSHVIRLKGTLPLIAAAVVGSVARGDFNAWSDVDVVVVAESLPERIPDRSGLLATDAPGGVQTVGFTVEEFELAWRKGNPLAREATDAGVVLMGEAFLRTPRSGRSPT